MQIYVYFAIGAAIILGIILHKFDFHTPHHRRPMGKNELNKKDTE